MHVDFCIDVRLLPPNLLLVVQRTRKRDIIPALTVLNMLTTYAFQNGSDHVNFAWSLSELGPTLVTMFRTWAR